MDIIKITNLPENKGKLKVCAYARVSKEKETMLHSLNAQVDYYSKLIKSHKEWKFAGIYADEGISGTKSDRPDFTKMVEDAHNGKIDLIITKSVSRFARNLVVLLNTCRELKRIGVDVYFEEQNIHTMSFEGEIMLTVFAATAEEEVKNMSLNMYWRIQKDMERGLVWGGNDPFGYHIVEKKYIVVPKEAKVVKMIFDLYQSGLGDTAIAKKLNKEGIKPARIDKWSKTTVRNLLLNVTYTGDLMLQKTYRPVMSNKRYKINKDTKPKYLVSDNHKPIVSKEQFQECVRIRAKRNAAYKDRKPVKSYPFTKMIKCGCCGSSFHHKVCTYQPKWMCKEADKMGKDYCTNKAIPERVLYKVIAEVLGLEEFDEIIFKEKVEDMVAYPNNLLVINFKDKTSKEVTWVTPSRKDSWTPEMKEQARQREERRQLCLQ